MTAPNAFLVDVNSTITPKIGVAVDPTTGAPSMLTTDHNGAQVVTVVGGGGGVGSVTSVASLSPDVGGNVPLKAATINAANLPIQYDFTANSLGLTSGVAPPDNNWFQATADATVAYFAADFAPGAGVLKKNDSAFFSGSAGKWIRVRSAAVGSVIPAGVTLCSDGSTDAGTSNITASIENWRKVLLTSSVPHGMPPSSTISANGAVVFGTPYTFVYPDCYLYFAQGQLSTTAATPGYAAGWYYARMADSTHAQVFTNYVAASLLTPLLLPYIASPTAFTGTTGIGANTGVTTNAQYGLCVGVPPLGPNGFASVETKYRSNTTSGAKALATVYGSLALQTLSSTTSGAGGGKSTVKNLGTQSAQICPQVAGTDTSVTGFNNSTIDGSVTQYIQSRPSLGTATDWIMVESIIVEAVYVS